MSAWSIGSVLRVGSALQGGRAGAKWFSLPGRPSAQQRRFGCGPAVLIDSMKSWQAGSRVSGASKAPQAGICLF